MVLQPEGRLQQNMRQFQNIERGISVEYYLMPTVTEQLLSLAAAEPISAEKSLATTVKALLSAMEIGKLVGVTLIGDQDVLATLVIVEPAGHPEPEALMFVLCEVKTEAIRNK